MSMMSADDLEALLTTCDNGAAWSRSRKAAVHLQAGCARFLNQQVELAVPHWLRSIAEDPSPAGFNNLAAVAAAPVAARYLQLQTLLFPGTVPGSVTLNNKDGDDAPGIKKKQVLAIYTGYSPSFTGANVEQRPVWGSEIAAVRLAESLAPFFDVFVFCPCLNEEEPTGVKGVKYLNLSYYGAFEKAHQVDILIVSRYIHVFLEFECRAKRIFLWLHDLVPHYMWRDLQLPADGVPFFANTLHRIERLLCVSPWHAEAFPARLGGLSPSSAAAIKDKISVMPNALNPEHFGQLGDVDRVPGRMLFCSDPVRGLEPLFHIFQNILQTVPTATLHVYWSALPPHLLAAANAIPGVTFMGKATQAQLARAMAASELLVYPALSHETYCMVALEAQAAGCVVITRNHTGLTSTAAKGVLIDGDPSHPDVQAVYTQHACELLLNPSKRLEKSEAATAWALSQTWEKRVTENWLPLLLCQ